MTITIPTELTAPEFEPLWAWVMGTIAAWYAVQVILFRLTGKGQRVAASWALYRKEVTEWMPWEKSQLQSNRWYYIQNDEKPGRRWISDAVNALPTAKVTPDEWFKGKNYVYCKTWPVVPERWAVLLHLLATPATAVLAPLRLVGKLLMLPAALAMGRSKESAA